MGDLSKNFNRSEFACKGKNCCGHSAAVHPDLVDALPAALRAAQPFGVTALPQGPHWLQLPDGLAVELIQAAPGSVAQALAVKART